MALRESQFICLYKLNRDTSSGGESSQYYQIVLLLVDIYNFLVARWGLCKHHHGVGRRGRVQSPLRCSSSLPPVGGEDTDHDDGDEEGEVENSQDWTGVVRPRTNIFSNKHSPNRDLSLAVVEESLLSRYEQHGGHVVSDQKLQRD